MGLLELWVCSGESKDKQPKWVGVKPEDTPLRVADKAISDAATILKSRTRPYAFWNNPAREVIGRNPKTDTKLV